MCKYIVKKHTLIGIQCLLKNRRTVNNIITKTIYQTRTFCIKDDISEQNKNNT